MLWNSDSSLAFLAQILYSISTYSFCVVASPPVCFADEMQNALQDEKMVYDYCSCDYSSLNVWAFVADVALQALELSAVQVLPAVPCNDLGSWAWVGGACLGA